MLISCPILRFGDASFLQHYISLVSGRPTEFGPTGHRQQLGVILQKVSMNIIGMLLDHEILVCFDYWEKIAAVYF